VVPAALPQLRQQQVVLLLLLLLVMLVVCLHLGACCGVCWCGGRAGWWATPSS
jgi:hypothetical protein